MPLKYILLFCWMILFSGVSYAQNSACEGNDFDAMGENCITKHADKFARIDEREKKRLADLNKAKAANKDAAIKRAEQLHNLVFPIGKEVKQLPNTVYFYQTNIGNRGKFIIKSVEKTAKSCSIYIKSNTYLKSGPLSKDITLVIKNEANSWNIDRTSLDERGGTDFELVRQHNTCLFKRVGAKAFKHKKLQIIEVSKGNEILLNAGLFLIGLAVFLIARTVFQDEDRFKAQEKLEDAEQEEKKTVPNDIVLKYSRPFFKRYFSPIIQGMKSKKKIREKYKRPLASSGMNKFLTPEDFYAFKLFLIIGFPILYLGLRAFLEESWPLIYTPFISIAGFYYPDFWIKGKSAQRKAEVLDNMPFVVDMLALSVEAGLDFVAAMHKVIEKAPPSALVDEFEIMIKETKVGASRADGLRNLGWRIDALPMTSFCATLIAADSVGANIGPILKTLAQELREKRSSKIEEKGAQAATKMLIPMIFFVLPSVILVIVGPIILQLMGVV